MNYEHDLQLTFRTKMPTFSSEKSYTNMKASEIYKTLFWGASILALNSCVFLTKDEVVKNDPHDSQWQIRQEQQALAAAAANGQKVPTPVAEQIPTTPQPQIQQTEPAQQIAQTKQQVTSTAATTAKNVTEKAEQAKQQAKTSVTTTTPKTEAPKPTVAPATDTTQAEKKITSLKDITNENGYIPTAKPVPGDPTRVYNPLVPSKTIRILDKNGNPHPAGTKLKVKGTNYMFYVP